MTLRLRLDGSDAFVVGNVTAAISEAAGVLVGLDVVRSSVSEILVDATTNASDALHAEEIREAIQQIPGVRIHRWSDRTFLLHLGGKIAVSPKVPLATRDDLSMAYTPGVARVSRAIAACSGDAARLTTKANTVAIVTDGSAVLGLGDVGPAAALPVMEGKAALFKRLAGVDAWPVCLDVSETDEVVAVVRALAPSYGGVNLEDIAAPRCFEIEERLRDVLDIPVFHDDQHGTAIVVLAALYNALRLVNKRLGDIAVAVAGAGAAGMAITKLLLREGVGDVVVVDREGILDPLSQALDASKCWLAEHTNHHGRRGDLREAIRGADVFIGVSRPRLLEPIDLVTMAPDPIVFPLANPDPEVDPTGARQYAAVIATGRSDHPNQINNVLAFPGVFRGVLDARARHISEDMKVAAARAIAEVIDPSELHRDYIIPSAFNDRVVPAVAAAVGGGATAQEAPRRLDPTEYGDPIEDDADTRQERRWCVPEPDPPRR